MTQMRPRDPSAPKVSHPIDNRHALLYVTFQWTSSRFSTKMRAMYTSQHPSTVDIFCSSDDLLSHAAFGEDGNHLILATHDESRRLRLYKIIIHWNVTPLTRGNQHAMTVAPTLEIGHLTALDRVSPQMSDVARLSHLSVVPVPLESERTNGGATLSPVVLGVYTYAASQLDTLQAQPDTVSVPGSMACRVGHAHFTRQLCETENYRDNTRHNVHNYSQTTARFDQQQADFVCRVSVLALPCWRWSRAMEQSITGTGPRLALLGRTKTPPRCRVCHKAGSNTSQAITILMSPSQRTEVR